MDHQLRRAVTAKINKPGTEAFQACLLFFMLKRILSSKRYAVSLFKNTRSLEDGTACST